MRSKEAREHLVELVYRLDERISDAFKKGLSRENYWKIEELLGRIRSVVKNGR